jgi:hypothetical protein
MGEKAALSFGDAKDQYEAKSVILAEICQCKHCSPKKSGLKSPRYCLVLLVETILSMGLVLSNAIIADGLLPKRSGFQASYQRQLVKRRRFKDSQRPPATMGPIS